MIQSGYQSLGPFNRLEIGAGLSVLVTRGDAFSVRVETDNPSRLAKLDMRVIEGRLQAKCGSSFKDFIMVSGLVKPGARGHAIRLIITAPELLGIKASAASVVSIDTLTGDEVDIGVSTNAEATIDSATVRSFRLKASTRAKLTIAGACDVLHASFAQHGLIAATELSCTDAVVDGSHGGTLELTAIGSVGGSLSSGANMHLLGRPDTLAVKTSSDGMLVTS